MKGVCCYKHGVRGKPKVWGIPGPGSVRNAGVGRSIKYFPVVPQCLLSEGRGTPCQGLGNPWASPGSLPWVWQGLRGGNGSGCGSFVEPATWSTVTAILLAYTCSYAGPGYLKMAK